MNRPTDPFELTLVIYDELISFISRTQLISKSFLSPDRPLTDIYDPKAFRELTDDLNQEFAPTKKLTVKEVRAAKTIGRLGILITNRV